MVPAPLRVAITLVDAEDAHLTLDGQIGHQLCLATRSAAPGPDPITLLQSPALPFFALLQQKLHWGDR